MNMKSKYKSIKFFKLFVLLFLFIFLILNIYFQLIFFRKNNSINKTLEINLNHLTESFVNYYPYYDKEKFMEIYIEEVSKNLKNNLSKYYISFEFVENEIYVKINNDFYRKYLFNINK